MTWLIAFVFAARQCIVTWHRADVVNVDAALLVALVFAAGAFLYTALFAASIVSSGRELAALNHLVHVTAAAFDGCLFVARRTITMVTLVGAVMGMSSLTTTKSFVANAIA